MGELLHCFPVEWRTAAHTAELWTCLHNRPWVLPLTAPHPKKRKRERKGSLGKALRTSVTQSPETKVIPRNRASATPRVCVCM